MSQDKIKGSIIVNYVRIIRANKDLPWDDYLTKEDMSLVQGKIMPSTWYSLDVFERIGYAVFMLIGKGDLNVARTFGAFTMQDTFHKIYENVVFQEKDLISALKKIVVLRKQFIRFEDPDFESLRLELLEDNKVKLIIKAPDPSKYLEAYVHQIAGGFEKLLEMLGAKDGQARILKLQTETEPSSEIELSWSSVEDKKD